MSKHCLFRLTAAAAIILAATAGVCRPPGEAASGEREAQSYSIKSLFDEDDAPWDLESIQAMTLEDLAAVNVDLDGDGLYRFDQKRHADHLDLDYRQIEYEWGNENDTYFMLSRSGESRGFGKVELKHHAVIFVPEGYPDKSVKGYGHAALYNVHKFPPSSRGGVIIRSDEKMRALRAVQLYEVPVVLHGETANNWEQLGFENQDAIFGSSSLAVAMSNSTSPDAFKRHYVYMLVRENLQAITLAGRVLDRIEPSAKPGERIGKGVLCRGSSKQGAACLFVGMTGDERVRVLMAGRNHMLSDRGGLRYVTDWGYPDSPDDYPWIETTGMRSDREKLRRMAGFQLSMAEWSLAAKEGEPGRIYSEIFGFERQIDALDHIDLVTFYGQVGRYKSLRWKGEKVGYFSEHDKQFPLGAETGFLDRLDGAKWRYAREKPDHEGSPPRYYTRPDQNWLEAIHQLIDPDPSRWIKVVSTETRLKKKKFTVKAKVEVGDPRKDDELRLYYSLSEGNRCWNDWEHNDRATPGRPWHPWTSVPMRKSRRGEYEVTVDVGNEEWSIAWYVEAAHVIDKSRRPALKVFDCTAPRFEREAPIKPENRGCSDVGTVTIEGCDPETAAAGEMVAVNVEFASRRVSIQPDLAYFFLELNVDVALLHDGAEVDRRRVPIARAREAKNTATLYWEVPEDANAGEHTLTAVVDPPGDDGGGMLFELDEENNVSAPIKVKVAAR